MLETKEIEKEIKSRILSVFPDFEFEFCETVKSRILSVFPNYDFELNKKINFRPRTNNEPGTVYIYAQDGQYHYITIGDRGAVFHDEFTSEDDVLYALLAPFIFRKALDYEKEHREPGKDYRRIWFNKEIELYSKFGKEFEERKTAQINEILRKAPYHDEE